MTTIPNGWSKTRVLITGPSGSSKFTVPLREPVYHVALVAAVSIQGASAILQIEGLNMNKMSTLDASGNVYHFDYVASNLNTELQYALYTPPVLPSQPQTNKNVTQVSVTLLDVFGNLNSVSGAVNIELDFWSYVPPASSGLLSTSMSELL